jgi:hypothetical protein
MPHPKTWARDVPVAVSPLPPVGAEAPTGGSEGKRRRFAVQDVRVNVTLLPFEPPL